MYPDEKFLVEEASFETIRRQRSSMTITRCLLLLTLMVLACADRSRRVADKPAIHLLRIDATVEQAAGELQGVVTIANPASQPVKFGITTLPCAYNIMLLSSAGAVVWDQRRSPAGDPGGCKAGLLDFELVPGDSLRLATRTVSRGELGDSLKGGAYSTEIEVVFARMVPHPELADALTTQVDSVLSIPAGTVQID